MKKTKSDYKFYEDYADHWLHPDEGKIKDLESRYKIKILSSMIPKRIKIDNILEFGCGNAAGLRFMAEKRGSKNLFGIDISQKMVELAKKNCPKGKFLKGGLEVLKKFNEPIDLILLLDILEHLPDPQKALEVASQKASFLGIKIPLEKTLVNRIIGYSSREAGHLHFFSEDDFLKILESANLKIVSKKVAFPPKEIALNDFFLKKAQHSSFSFIKIPLLRILKLLPYCMVSSILSLKNGQDLFIFCSLREV